MLAIILLLVSFLLGSIPFGYIIARLASGIDIRKHGSGNIGATNVVRVLGKKWGILVFILDLAKGMLGPCLFAYFLDDPNHTLILLSAILAVSGHNWTPFLKFKGGKGVATSLGAMIGLGFIFHQLWLIIGISLMVWVIVFKISKYVSLASLCACICFSILSVLSAVPVELKIFSLLFLVFVFIRHKSNILGLLQKKENRF